MKENHKSSFMLLSKYTKFYSFMKPISPFSIIAFVLGGLFVSCNKNEILQLEATLIHQIPNSGSIQRIISDHNTFIVIGGERWKSGYATVSYDNGKSWIIIDTISKMANFYLTDAHVVSPNSWYLCGYGGLVFSTNDGGITWELLRLLSYEALECLTIDSNQRLLAGGGSQFFSGKLYQSTNLWWQMTSDSFPIKIWDLYSDNVGHTVAAGHGSIYRKSMDTNKWERYTAEGDLFFRMTFPVDQIGYVCGANGSVWKISTKSTIAERVLKPNGIFRPIQIWRDIHFFDSFYGCVIGDGQQVAYTKDGGITWSYAQVNISDQLTALLMVDKNIAWIGTQTNKVYEVHLQ